MGMQQVRWAAGLQGWKHRFLVGMMITAASISMPVRAELLPEPNEIVLPEEEAAFTNELLPLVRSSSTDFNEIAQKLDKLLGHLRQPTQFRGYVQFLRAMNFLNASDTDAAQEAAEESVRLLPGFSGPLLLAVSAYTYSEDPTKAADFLMRASAIDPEMTKTMPEYDISALIGRLEHQDDQRRAALLSERLLEIGWVPDSLLERSALARRAIKSKIAEGSVAGAKSLIPKLIAPSDSYALLMQKEYEEIWPDIEIWSGSKLENQWRIYLQEARNKWMATRDPAATLDYARALRNANHYQTIINDIYPMISTSLDKRDDFDMIFVVSIVADALARKGRWADIDALYVVASNIWPLGENANALNIAANQARLLLNGDRPEEALELMNAVIADAERWGEQVNGDALAAMHLNRACMRHLLGDEKEAIIAAAAGRNAAALEAYTDTLLCLGDPESARDVLLYALENEEDVENVLSYLQKHDEVPMQSDIGRQRHERAQALRSDPRLLEAIRKRGRVLDFSLAAGAPE